MIYVVSSSLNVFSHSVMVECLMSFGRLSVFLIEFAFQMKNTFSQDLVTT